MLKHRPGTVFFTETQKPVKYSEAVNKIYKLIYGTEIYVSSKGCWILHKFREVEKSRQILQLKIKNQEFTQTQMTRVLGLMLEGELIKEGADPIYLSQRHLVTNTVIDVSRKCLLPLT